MAKNITKQMLKIYKPASKLDWMNYKITKRSNVTYHHIIKNENEGKQSIENGALLMPVAHEYLHTIEVFDIDSYDKLNRIFRIINDQGKEPNVEQRKLIEGLLLSFENEFEDYKGSKGKKILKYEYKIRGFEE